MFNDNRAEDFEFYVVPKQAEFFTENGGASRHLLVNGTNKRCVSGVLKQDIF